MPWGARVFFSQRLLSRAFNRPKNGVLRFQLGSVFSLKRTQGSRRRKVPFGGVWYLAAAQIHVVSLPEFMNFKLFGKIILVVNIKFGLFVGHPLSQ